MTNLSDQANTPIITETMMPFERLVDREPQINRFTTMVERIKQKRPIPTTLYELYGAPRIGKSSTIRMLVEVCREHHTPYTGVNFKEQMGRIALWLADPTRLLEYLLDNFENTVALGERPFLQEQIDRYRAGQHPQQPVHDYLQMPQDMRLYKRPAWVDQLREVGLNFLALIERLSAPDKNTTQPVAFFFDEAEYASPELVDWIEEWLINPLTQSKWCIVVWAARSPWRWKRPEVRRRLISEELKAFTLDEVQKQMRTYQWQQPSLVEQFFRGIYDVTGGHPYANRLVIEQVHSWEGGEQPVDQNLFASRKEEMLRELYDRLIYEHAFNRLETPEERLACELLSMVRLFDTTMMREILTACRAEQFERWSYEDFGDLSRRLRKSQLLVWNTGKGYAIDPALRHIIREYYELCAPKDYRTANETAYRVYGEWLAKPVDNRALFVIEALYHQACLRIAGGQEELVRLLREQVDQYHQWIRIPDVRQEALARLEGELAHDVELRRLVGDELMDRLVEAVREGGRE